MTSEFTIQILPLFKLKNTMYFNLRYKNVPKTINWGNLQNLRKKTYLLRIKIYLGQLYLYHGLIAVFAP